MSKRKRTVRREEDRAMAKMAKDLDKLALHAPGGSPERAIEITSPSEVEVQARSTPCPICRGELRIEEHTAETIDGLRVRVAKVLCTVCRSRRSLYFRLAGTMLN
ncbi:Hypothetical protein A7982_05006 [Minicystis rosea]|nr:Hypothetical protein A7982_05006 [Minicystis rosea]